MPIIRNDDLPTFELPGRIRSLSYFLCAHSD
jgi:hypothetical protein